MVTLLIIFEGLGLCAPPRLKLQKEQEMREFKDVDRVDNFGHGYAISDLCVCVYCI